MAYVPRFKVRLCYETLNEYITLAVEALGYQKATHEQRETVNNFVLCRDVFVYLPTGAGKSVCYAALPLVFDNIRAHSDRETTCNCSIV